MSESGDQPAELSLGWVTGQADSLATGKTQPARVQSEPEQGEDRSGELNNQVSGMTGVSAMCSAAPHNERQQKLSGNGYDVHLADAGMSSSIKGNDACEDPDVAFFNTLGNDGQYAASPATAQGLEPTKNDLGHSQTFSSASIVPREHPQIYSQNVNEMVSNDNNHLGPVDNSHQVLQSRSINSNDYSHQRYSSSFQNHGQPEFASSVTLEAVDDVAFFDMLGDIADGEQIPTAYCYQSKLIMPQLCSFPMRS